MALGDRSDLALAGGLAGAALLAFSSQVSELSNAVQGLDVGLGAPALPLAAAATFGLGLVAWKYRQALNRADRAEHAARRATNRAEELVRLVEFNRALSQALDVDRIKAVSVEHLPHIFPGRGVWALTGARGRWDVLVEIGTSAARHRERAARIADGEPEHDRFDDDTETCVPMVVGAETAGVLGVSAAPDQPVADPAVVSAVASSLAIACQNAEMYRDVRENSVRDSLTGCFTRAHALEVLEVELRRARRTQMPLSVVLIDLDNFSAINENHGRSCGNLVLEAIGQRLKATLRGSDVKCRFGAAEFLIILTDTPMGGALQVADTLRREISKGLDSWNEQPVRVDAHIGVATVRAGEVDPTAALARAQEALVAAKKAGVVRAHEGEFVAVPA